MTNLRPRLRKPGGTSPIRRVELFVGGSQSTAAPATVRTFFRPRWLALHVFVVVIAVTMVLLGRWQLRVSNDKHFDLQNFGYALQWWAFTAFGILLWLRIMRDARRPPAVSTDDDQLVVRAGEIVRVNRATDVGPADFVSPTTRPDQVPIVYRGYLMPQNSRSQTHSDGDLYHGAYNDYLWQLGLADAADRNQSTPARPSAPDPRSLDAAIDAEPGPSTNPSE